MFRVTRFRSLFSQATSRTASGRRKVTAVIGLESLEGRALTSTVVTLHPPGPCIAGNSHFEPFPIYMHASRALPGAGPTHLLPPGPNT
jgi:hypothetical protein